MNTVSETSAASSSLQELSGHYIVCGMGHVGRRVALLLRRLGYTVAAVYDQAPDEWLCEADQAGVIRLQGDARNDRLLLKAGVARARGIIAATDRDMVNLSVALDGLQANPEIAAVVRLYDQELGHQIQSSLNARQVLSASALAAPVFVAAALGQEAIAYFDYLGRHYIVTDTEADPDAVPDEATVPLFCSRVGGAECATPQADPPPRGLSIRLLPGAATPKRRWSERRQTLGAVIEAVRQTPRGMRWLVAGLIALMFVGILAVHATMDLGYLDAMYFIVTTITTTGYGDVSFLHAPAYMKVFGCFLMLSGVALLTLLLGIITDAVISNRFRGVIAGHGVRGTGHVVVAGSGHIMVRILEELVEEGLHAVAVCPTAGNAPALRALRVPFIEGDSRMESVLRRAGVENAAAFISVHDDDVMNLGAGLLAKKLGPGIRTVVRVFDGALAAKLQQQLAVDRVVSLAAVSAPMFVAACLHKDVLCATLWRDHLLVIRRFMDTGETPAAGSLSVLLCQEPGTGRLDHGLECGPGLEALLLPLNPELYPGIG